jgi:uncharacterized protein YjiK
MNTFIALLISGLVQFNAASQEPFRYNLNKPAEFHELPAILTEVSGLTDIDSSHVACVQDELGTVFIFNFKTNKIISQHAFDTTGDFEGLTYTGSSIYILRSDGRLTEWSHFNQDPNQGTIHHYKLPVVTSNNEGLCYDHRNNRLLIAAKSNPSDHDAKSERLIYAFDLSKKQLLEKPVYILNTDQLASRAKSFNIQSNEVSAKGKVKPFNFRPASLAVHPQSDDLYIISASDKMLIVMNRNSEIIHMQKLDPELFPKAEGITFLQDGTMIITNEAAGKTPTLLLFNMI